MEPAAATIDESARVPTTDAEEQPAPAAAAKVQPLLTHVRSTTDLCREDTPVLLNILQFVSSDVCDLSNRGHQKPRLKCSLEQAARTTFIGWARETRVDRHASFAAGSRLSSEGGQDMQGRQQDWV